MDTWQFHMLKQQKDAASQWIWIQCRFIGIVLLHCHNGQIQAQTNLTAKYNYIGAQPV